MLEQMIDPGPHVRGRPRGVGLGDQPGELAGHLLAPRELA
jgi:hypothetical protein